MHLFQQLQFLNVVDFCVKFFQSGMKHDRAVAPYCNFQELGSNKGSAPTIEPRACFLQDKYFAPNFLNVRKPL